MGLRFDSVSNFNPFQLLYAGHMMSELAPHQQEINDSQKKFADSPILSYKASDWGTQRKNYETQAGRMLDLKLKDLRHTNEFHSFHRRADEANAVQQMQQGLMNMDIQHYNQERNLQYQDAQAAMQRQQQAISGQLQGLLSPMNYQLTDNIVQSSSPITGAADLIGQMQVGLQGARVIGGLVRNNRNYGTPERGAGGGLGVSAGGGSGSSAGGMQLGGFGGSLS